MEIPIYVPPAADWDGYAITGYAVRVKYLDEYASLLTANGYSQVHRTIDDAFEQALEVAKAFQSDTPEDSAEVSIVALVGGPA